MTIIESNKKTILKDQNTIFDFLSDLDNWEQLMPDRVINWSSDKETCNFTIQGTADLGMQVQEKLEHSKITLKDYGKVPFPFSLIVDINSTETNNSEVLFAFHADLNPMLKLMAVNPLRNFLNMLTDKLYELNN